MFVKLIISILVTVAFSILFDTRNWFFNLSDILLSRNSFEGYIIESGVAYLISGIIIITIIVHVLMVLKLITLEKFYPFSLG